MSEITDRSGQIVTFYSFKGGAGRTMTLANIAFLTALNGHKVLVMDWDLEAPGLAYYFRCLQDAAGARELKETPGVLDLLWNWTVAARQSASDEDFSLLHEKYRSGELFDECVYPLLPEGEFGCAGSIDFIGAGSRQIEAIDAPYEDALSRFSWQTFFDDEIGGVMLEEFRSWAKSNFDFVFLDSRTGLADVAGICTMQMPDLVALCFVLNRQSIDGVARVSNAIRTKRADQVAVRAVPMRVVQRVSASSETSDAEARAINELTRVGGFSKDAAREDLRLLTVSASESVPYYETLVPFLVDDATLDPLTLNYVRVANHLLDRAVAAVPLDADWVEVARRRMQPRLATIDYINKLRTADPDRVFNELGRLIENTFEAVYDGSLPDLEYVEALMQGVEAAESVDTIQASDLYPPALDLLRALLALDPSTWLSVFTRTLDRYLDSFVWMVDDEEAITLLDELDGLLAAVPTTGVTIKRIGHRRQAAEIFMRMRVFDNVAGAISEIRKMIAEIISSGHSLAADQQDALLCARVDAYLQEGVLYETKDQRDAAFASFKEGLELLAGLPVTSASVEVRRLGFQLNRRLARLGRKVVSPQAAGRYAIDSMRWCPTVNWRAIYFSPLAEKVLQAPDAAAAVLNYCEAVFVDTDVRTISVFAGNIGRNTRLGHAFLQTTLALLPYLVSPDNGRTINVLGTLLNICNTVVSHHFTPRRRGQLVDNTDLLELIAQLKDAFAQFGLVLIDEVTHARSTGRIHSASDKDLLS